MRSDDSSVLHSLQMFFSYSLGRNSYIASKASSVLEMALNLVLAVVCIGYISMLLQLIVPVSKAVASGLSFGFLLCALPFELLNTQVQNSDYNKPRPDWVDAYPVLAFILAMLSTVLGSVQYLIRNYNLVRNFALTPTGGFLLAHLSQSTHILISAGQFAVLGGIIGFMAHLLLAYGNWDKLITKKAIDYHGYRVLDGMVWGAALSICAYYIFPIILSIQLPKLLLIGGGLYGGLMVFPWQKVRAMWLRSAIYTLPVGALLYTLVDFFNSYKVVSSLGMLSPITGGACLLFGMFSWLNVVQIWGYNTCLDIQQKTGRVADNSHPNFVRWYWTHAACRRVSAWTKELLLLGLDLLNNRLALPMVNQVLMNVAGVTVSLNMLSLCTISYAMNRFSILYFQSSEESAKVVSDKFNQKTLITRICDRVVNGASNTVRTI